MTADRVTTTWTEGVAVVRLDDPATRNALDGDMQEQIARALRRACDHADLRAVVLTGGDDLFASGADIGELARTRPTAITDPARRVLWDTLAALTVPVVAGVAGYVLGGGCEVALACDLVVAGDRAVLGLPEIRLGIIPGAGGVQRWGRLTGRLRAAERVLTGSHVDAWTALDLGLVNRVVPQERTVAGAIAMARELEVRAPLAVRAAKQALVEIDETPMSVAVAHDRARMALLLDTDDATEGLTAFLDKRTPDFRGR